MKLEKIAANIVIQLIILLPLEISLSLAAPPAVSDVQVVALDNTNVMVNFTTDQEADTRVNFGFDQNLGLFEKSLGLVQNHTITISGLQPDTLYYFKASAENELGELGEGSIIEARTYKTNEILFVNLTKLKEEPIDTVVVEWETSADSDSILYYGNASDNLDRNIPDASEVKKHSITLSGLEKGKRYYYKVKSSYVESEVYDFVAPVDITPPELTYTKPAEFMTDSTLVISGTISENATINIRSGVYPLTEERVLEGEINVSAELYQGLNKIELSATDDHGNYFREYFNVTVDSEAPEIKLIDFTNYAPFEDKNISLKTDEDARITVKLNNESVASTDDYVDNFNHTLKITKDENTLEILAEDAAGNIGRVEEEITKMKELYLEILAPNISDEDIAKKVGNRYKMSVGKTINIVGKTNPGAKVKIWMTYDELRETGNFSPDYEATAGENGIFTIEVEIKDIVTRAEYKKYEEYYKNRGGGDFETFSAEAEYNLEVTYFLRIEAEDEYGRKNKEGPLVLEVTRDKCGSSYPWIVEIVQDEHEFKPYRLQDGHELVEFKIKLDWIGLGENPKITNVIVREQERTPEMFEDTGKSKLTTDFVGGAEQYKCLTEGNIFPRTYKARNFDANRTYWYLLYKLNPWEGLNDTMVSSWSEAFRNLRNKRCMMPLKVVIDYEFTPLDVPLEGEPIAGTERRQQEFCFTQENLIEDKVDPNMVIPEWLLEGSIDFIDSALKALGPIEEGLGLAYDIARGVCLGLLINYAIKKIAVRVKCARATKSGGQNDDEYDPGDAEDCAKAVSELKTLYNRYRFACDRVWCKSAPSDPMADEETKVTGEIRGKTITVSSDAPGKNEMCESHPDFVLVERATYYKYYCGTEGPVCYPTKDMEGLPQDSPVCCCRKKDMGVIETVDKIVDETHDDFKSKVPEWFEGEESASYLFYGSGQWFVDDNDAKWNFGAWAGYGHETAEGLVSPVFVGVAGYAAGLEKKIEVKKALKGKSTTTNHLYDTYVSGVYGPSCFNQQPWFNDERLYLTPSQNFFDSIQCGCISDIYGRVQQWQNILKAVKACLEEIKLTGEAEAGACKALFTQYACDLLTWVAVKGAMIITKGIDATQEKRPDQVPLGEAMTIGLTEAVTSFKEDYGGAARLAPDFSMERLIHAVCIFAFTNEWEPGFGGLFGADREGPPRQSAVFIAPAKRELLGSDPISGKAYFEYRVGVSFTAGSKIRYYDVKLKCDAEGDCPGTIPNPRLFKSSPEIKTGRISNIEQNEFSSVQGVMYVDGLDYRYNKVEVCWRSEAGDKYSGCDEADITPVVDATLFGCRATPGAGLGGNDLFGCEILATQSKSQFVRIPPARHTVTVVRDNQALDIPFSIQTIYETPEEEANPYLLSIEEITQSGLGARPVEDEFPLPDGLITHEQVGTMPSVRYGEIFGSGLATITVEPEDNSTESRQTCSSAVIDPGPVTASTTLYVHFSGLENKKISINEKRGGEPYGLTSDNCEPGINYCCGGTLCNYANKKLTLKIEGSTVTIPSPQQKARCKISITGGEGSRQQLVKKYRISIHSNNGEGGFGPVVYVGEQEQSYDVEVTLNRGEMTMAQPQEVREGQVRIYSPFTEYRVEKLGDSVNVIEIQGNYNFVRYYIENEAGKVVQDGYEFSQTQINEIKTTKNNMPEFEIKDPRITSPGVYFLKIQAGNQIAGQAFRPQTGEVQLNIGTGEVKLNKPVNLRELEQYELVTNPNVRVVTIEWKSNPNIEHIVKSEQEGILQNVAKGIGRLSLEISKGAKEKNVTIQVIAKSGTVTSDPSEITVTIPGGTGAGGSGLPTP